MELRSLIRRMAAENPLWGEERIANELLVKLGIRDLPSVFRAPTSGPHAACLVADCRFNHAS